MLLVIERREGKRAIKTNSKVSQCSKVLVVLSVFRFRHDPVKQTNTQLSPGGVSSLISLLSVLLIMAESSEESFIMLRVKFFTFAQLQCK